MSEVIRLKKGLNIKLLGESSQQVRELPLAKSYGICPTDFVGVTPKLLVKTGDEVKAGDALFFNKNYPSMLFTAPVSGVVSDIKRGAQRVLEWIEIESTPKLEYAEFEVIKPATASADKIQELLLKSGLWATIIERPFGLVASPEKTPKTIWISAFDTAPLAADLDFVLKNEKDNLQTAVDMLKKMSGAEINIGVWHDSNGVMTRLSGVNLHYFKGKHPAGNIGVQIHNVDPINKGDTIWTIDAQNLMLIGRFFNTGVLDMAKIVALTGAELSDNHYVKTIVGAGMESLVKRSNIRPLNKGEKIRIISGNVLTGRKTKAEGYLHFYDNQVTVILEGDKYSFLGWAKPRLKKLSVSKSYFSWLMPRHEFELDTNLNGEVRPFVVTGLYEKYIPMDILPMHLLKAIIAQDVEKIEELGIYEVLEEDFALCEFVDPSKHEMQKLIRDGINLIMKELK